MSHAKSLELLDMQVCLQYNHKYTASSALALSTFCMQLVDAVLPVMCLRQESHDDAPRRV